MRNLKTFEPIDAVEENRLFREYEQTEDHEQRQHIRNKIITGNIRAVISFIKNYIHSENQEDYYQQAILLMIEKFEDYQYKYNTRFMTYCIYHLYKNIGEYRNKDRIIGVIPVKHKYKVVFEKIRKDISSLLNVDLSEVTDLVVVAYIESNKEEVKRKYRCRSESLLRSAESESSPGYIEYRELSSNTGDIVDYISQYVVNRQASQEHTETYYPDTNNLYHVMESVLEKEDVALLSEYIGIYKNAEGRLISIDPVTLKELSEKTGKDEKTLKVYINHLLFKLREYLSTDGIYRFR